MEFDFAFFDFHRLSERDLDDLRLTQSARLGSGPWVIDEQTTLRLPSRRWWVH